MKNTILILITLLMIFCSSKNSSESQNRNQKSKESFDEFLMNFCYDEDFQNKRIKFPLKHLFLNDELTEVDSGFIDSKEWKFNTLGFKNETHVKYQIFNNFQRNIPDTNERVFAIYGIDDGLEQNFYFKRIDGLWFLVQFEDLSN